MTTKIPLISECKFGHCELHFPQFNCVNEQEHFEQLARCIKDGEDSESYFSKAYTNAKEQTEIFKQSQALPFRESCEFLYVEMKKLKDLKQSTYIDTNFYRTLQMDRIVRFFACCR